jgi:hypothetical protein
VTVVTPTSEAREEIQTGVIHVTPVQPTALLLALLLNGSPLLPSPPMNDYQNPEHNGFFDGNRLYLPRHSHRIAEAFVPVSRESTSEDWSMPLTPFSTHQKGPRRSFLRLRLRSEISS